MRIVLGAEALIGPRTGIGRYAWHLYRGLRDLPAVEDIRALANQRFIDPFALPPAEPPQSAGTSEVRSFSLRRYVGALPFVATAAHRLRSAQFALKLRSLGGESRDREGLCLGVGRMNGRCRVCHWG